VSKVDLAKVIALARAEHAAMSEREQDVTLTCAEESIIECGDDEYGGGMPPIEFRQVLMLLYRERDKLAAVTAERDRFALELARMKLTEHPPAMKNCVDCVHIRHFENDGCFSICGAYAFAEVPPARYFHPHESDRIGAWAEQCQKFSRYEGKTQARDCADEFKASLRGP
jgi:hypothetical protein